MLVEDAGEGDGGDGGEGGDGGDGGDGGGGGDPTANLSQSNSKSAPRPPVPFASEPGVGPPLTVSHFFRSGPFAIGSHAHGNHDTLYFVAMVNMASLYPTVTPLYVLAGQLSHAPFVGQQL